MLTLSIARARQLTTVIELLAQPLDADTLRERLVQPLAQLLDADVVASFVWQSAASGFTRGVCCGMAPMHLRDYEAGLQFEDSIAQALRPLRVPTLVSAVIPQRELLTMRFYNRFLASQGLRWGLNVFAHDGQRDVGDLRVWRHGDKANFSADDLALLRLLYPALVVALSRPGGAMANQPTRLERLTPPLFGTLSSREAAVVRLVASGAADKAIAATLGIAVTTVRTHLEHALRKTRCRSRRELIAAVAGAAAVTDLGAPGRQAAPVQG